MFSINVFYEKKFLYIYINYLDFEVHSIYFSCFWFNW